MAREIVIAMSVVVPDDSDRLTAAVHGLIGSSLPSLPASWITRARVIDLPAHDATDEDIPAAGRNALTPDELDAELDADAGLGTDA